MIISLDTETTGVDLAHGAMPFLVTTCDDEGVIRFWEWDVDPMTRRPEIPPDDLTDIAELIDAAELIYLHNAPFDARALSTVGIALPWVKVRDTMPASHLLATNRPHNLTWLCIEYLGVDIEKYELHVKEITQTCRTIAKRDFPNWVIADEGVGGMPSVKVSTGRDEDKPWKNDMWLPRALANQYMLEGDIDLNMIDQEWLTACSQYANADSEHTLPLGLEMERLLHERGLWKIYMHRLELQRVACEMMSYGITARGDYTDTTAKEYEQIVAEAECELLVIAAEMGHDLQLAKGASLNDNMRDFFYGTVHQHCPASNCKYFKRIKHWNGEDIVNTLCPKCINRKRAPASVYLKTTRRDNLKLPVVISDKTGNATLDKSAMEEYLQTLPDGLALDFVELLADKRVYDTALTYIHAYQRYWIPVPGYPGYYRIHPSLNTCGTDHLRWSSNSPNMQNVSGESKEISNRACFGPLPDREWWKMDYRSIEARIPAYESGEPKLVHVFDRPNEPPYWGSTYNLVASIFYPEKYTPHADTDGSFKKHEPRLYKRAKFFWLARQYGAGKWKGDLLAGFDGASEMIENDLPLLATLQDKYLRDAERIGYVETLPDRTIDPTRGYPILASRTEDGRVLSTTPFNYHISGTACQVKNVALVNCARQCAEWRAEGFDAHVPLEIHDEILFDFPRGKDMDENLPRALILKGLMEAVGGNLIPAIPTPVSVEYCAESWEKGVSV